MGRAMQGVPVRPVRLRTNREGGVPSVLLPVAPTFFVVAVVVTVQLFLAVGVER